MLRPVSGDYLSAAEVGAALGEDSVSVRAITRFGELDAIFVGGRYWFPRSGVVTYQKRLELSQRLLPELLDAMFSDHSKKLPEWRRAHVRVFFGQQPVDVWAREPRDFAMMLEDFFPGVKPDAIEDAPLGWPSQDEGDAREQKRQRRRLWTREWRSIGDGIHYRHGRRRA